MTTGTDNELLRLLWLTTLFPNPYRPGQATYALQAHGELSKLCSLNLVAPVFWIDRLGGSRDHTDYAAPPGVVHPVYYYPPRMLRNLHGWCLYRSAWSALQRQSSTLQPQVLLASFVYPDGYAGMLAAQRLGLPLVLQARGSDLMLLGDNPQRRPLIQRALKAAAQIITVSQALAHKAVELGANPDRVHHVPNGVDQDRFQPRDRTQARQELELDEPGPYLLFVGNMVPVKGLKHLFSALSQIPRAKLIMVGSGPLRPALEVQARELGIDERIIWAGNQGHERIPLYMAACDCLVLPSLSEGEPNVVLEALSCGRPVVASRVGGVPQMIQPGVNGYMSQPGDPESLASALKQALEQNWNPAEVAQTVSQRSWAASARGYLEVLQKAVHDQ
jgi:teichuronic acid biosynthesis glycosyltransferase TuaC